MFMNPYGLICLEGWHPEKVRNLGLKHVLASKKVGKSPPKSGVGKKSRIFAQLLRCVFQVIVLIFLGMYSSHIKQNHHFL